MIPLSVAEFATTVGGTIAGLAPDAPVTGPVVADSHQVTPGAVFVALVGERVDGHTFARAAVRHGASFMLATKPIDEPHVLVDDALVALARLATATVDALPDLCVIGVTGSTGKTSTKDLLGAVFSAAGPTIAAPGSYNGELGLPLSVLKASRETEYLVLEYGARGIGHIAGLTAIVRPDLAVVLNVGLAHVGVFGSVDAVAQAKGELVEALADDGVAVLNADDPAVAAMRTRTTARVVTFGHSPEADVRAADVALDAHGRASFRIVTPDDDAAVTLRLYGEHHVTNALAAAAAGTSAGVALADVARALSSAEPVSRWRMEVSEAPGGITVINDAYNANPTSTAAALRSLAWIGRDRRTWAVLGPMAELGEHTDTAHAEAGRLTAELGIARLVVVGAGASAISDGARSAGSGTEVDEVPDVVAAVELLHDQLRSGDVVLVKASRVAGLERVAAAIVAGAVPA